MEFLRHATERQASEHRNAAIDQGVWTTTGPKIDWDRIANIQHDRFFRARRPTLPAGFDMNLFVADFRLKYEEDPGTAIRFGLVYTDLLTVYKNVTGPFSRGALNNW